MDVLLVVAVDEGDAARGLDPDGAQCFLGDAGVLDDGGDAVQLLDPGCVVAGAVRDEDDDRYFVVLDEFEDQAVGERVAAADDVVLTDRLDRRGPPPFRSHIAGSYRRLVRVR